MQTIQRYRLLAEVGRGGMGVVHRALAPDGSTVALKVLRAGKGATPLQRRRFATEVQALLRLRHPGVVALLDTGEDAEGAPFLAMEWVEGESLAARLGRAGPLGPREAVELVLRLAAALEHCHAQGILHRDLTPGNVMLRASDGAPLLTDFGLSKDLADPAAGAGPRSLTGVWMGTPGYWPPEQARGELAAIGPRSDVYGLCGVLYAALTGEPPRATGTLEETLAALQVAPIPPGRRRAGVPRWLDAVCLRGLAIDPAGRFGSATELGRALAEGRAGELARRKGARRGAVAAAIGLLAAGGIAAGAIARPSPGGSAPDSEVAPEVHALWRKAEGLHAGGDHLNALVELERALALDPDQPRLHLGRGMVLAALERWAEALVAFDRALALDPTNARAWHGRGNARGSSGQHEGALADLTRAVALAPGSASAHSDQGAAFARLLRWREAIDCYERALALEPAHAIALENRGRAWAQLGEPGLALADFDRVVALQPGLARARAHRGKMLAALGRTEEVVRAFDEALALDPRLGPGAYEARGRALFELGRRPEAFADFDRAVELAPSTPLLRFSRALALLEAGRPAEALADCDRALELDPPPDMAAAIRQLRERARAGAGR